ncbi:MAG TPA: immunoglobulin domain-containing protein [Candidatus Angelobacter sp.]|nr:immunoglobulin domain-containing protein [Candidatus Angelobacter sp.]
MTAPVLPAPGPSSASITEQPVSQAIRLGDSATFSVKVSGTNSVRYQWSKNGTPISGAVASSYTTPPTVAADNDSTFAVNITDGLGLAVQSATARLLLNAPKTGDLRFQQVDAPSTIDGYTSIASSNIIGGLVDTWNGYGSPLRLLALRNCGPNSVPVNCSWFFFAFSSPDSGLVTTYQSNVLSTFQSDLKALPTNAAITQLDFQPANNAYAMSSVKSDPVQNFTPVTSATAVLADFAAAASHEAVLSHVITGVTFNGGLVNYVSFGWQSDTTTQYEVQVATAATLDDVPVQAALLAQSAYIVTAIGGDPTDGYLLVGTRVQGDTMPRPFKVVSSTNANPGPELFSQGYALIGTVEHPGVDITYMGEK